MYATEDLYVCFQSRPVDSSKDNILLPRSLLVSCEERDRCLLYSCDQMNLKSGNSLWFIVCFIMHNDFLFKFKKNNLQSEKTLWIIVIFYYSKIFFIEVNK